MKGSRPPEDKVRTTRIPTEELKRKRSRNQSRDNTCGPNDQNSDRGIETLRVHSSFLLCCVGPNDQNSDRGIETGCATLAAPCLSCPNDQNSDRGIETASLCLSPHFAVVSPNDQNSDRGIETFTPTSARIRSLCPNDQNSDRGIETRPHPQTSPQTRKSERPEFRPRN